MLSKDEFRKLSRASSGSADKLYSYYLLSEDKERKQVESLVRGAHFAKFENDVKSPKPLFAPPGAEESKGDYPLGRVVYDKPLYQFGLRRSEMTQHIGVYGRSGSGKTNFVFLLLSNLLVDGKPFLVFDWKRNFRPILKNKAGRCVHVYSVGSDFSTFVFNPLIVPAGISVESWAKKLVDVFCHAFFLGEGAGYLLLESLIKAYKCYKTPTVRDVYAIVQDAKATGRKALWRDSVLRTLGSLSLGASGKMLNSGESVSVVNLLNRNVILELDNLSSSEKVFVIESLMLSILQYRMRSSKREKFEHAIIIEEAHHVVHRRKLDIDGKETIADVLLREVREYGESVVIVDQHPSLVSVPALGNAYCTLAFNLKHGDDVVAMSKSLALSPEERESLSRLEVGTAVVRLQGRFSYPFVVGFPEVEIRKSVISDDELNGFSCRGCSRCSGRERAKSGMLRVAPPPAYGECSKEEMLFLSDIDAHPFSSIRSRIDRLGMSSRAGTTIKDELVKRGEIRQVEINTEKGRRALLERVPPPHLRHYEGVEHRFWKYVIGKAFGREGWKESFEERVSKGIVVDVVARKGGRKIAIEVETGKSDYVWNLVKLLPLDFEIISIGTTPGITGEIRRKLKLSELSSNNRISVYSAKEIMKRVKSI